MFSRVARYLLIISGNLIWFCGGAPCHFIGSPAIPVPVVSKPTKSYLRRSFELGHNLVNRIYVVFVSYRLITLSYQNAPLSIIMQLIYVLVCYTLSVIIDFHTIVNKDLPYYLIQMYSKFFSKIQDKHAEKKGRSIVKSNTFLVVFFVVGNLIYLQNLLIIRKHPTAPHFFISAVAHQSKAVKAVLVLIQCWVWFNLWTNLYFYIFSFYVYACCAQRFVREIK